MKRYLEEHEIKVIFFTAYFLYGRSKYGDLERGDIRLARIAACRGVMQVCRGFMESGQPVLRTHLATAFGMLEQQADRLEDGTFRRAYLETLAAFGAKA